MHSSFEPVYRFDYCSSFARAVHDFQLHDISAPMIQNKLLNVQILDIVQQHVPIKRKANIV